MAQRTQDFGFTPHICTDGPTDALEMFTTAQGMAMKGGMGPVPPPAFPILGDPLGHEVLAHTICFSTSPGKLHARFQCVPGSCLLD